MTVRPRLYIGPLLAEHQLQGGGGGFPNNIRRLL
jgi:hypothetical protein